MAESGPVSGQSGPVTAAAAMAQAADSGAAIAALRAGGGERFDPVRFRYIEALCRRAQAHRGDARRLLDDRLSGALQEFGARFEQARSHAGEVLQCTAAQHPEAAEAMQLLFAAGDFAGLHRHAADLARNAGQTPLAGLAAYLAQHSPVAAEGSLAADAQVPAGAPAELKAVRYFRDTWSKLSVEQQLAQALAQGPENAGPLNSHLLVLRSLKLMRDLSPDYLNRFMSYVDALLWLDQADSVGTPVIRKTPPAAKTA